MVTEAVSPRLARLPEPLTDGPSPADPGRDWSVIRSSAEARAALRRSLADRLDDWRALNRFYQDKVTEYLRFLIPEGESVLYIGCEDGAALTALRPSRGVGVDNSPEMLQLARERHPQHEYVLTDFDGLEVGGPFGYVVIAGIASESDDLIRFLQRLVPLCLPTSRVIVVQYNFLWSPILKLASRLRLRRPDLPHNWLSAANMQTFLYAVGLETVAVRRKLWAPRSFFGLGRAINAVCGLLPLVDRLAGTEFIVARPVPEARGWQRKTCTVCLTVRDERENIEPLVRSIPQVGRHTEIIFVEGHSTDGTADEVRRVARAYPEKDVKLLIQDGIGQGDATQKGFAAARGDVVIILEADQTSPAADVAKVFELIATGRADYVNGTRFVYPKQRGSMPRLNILGNLLFAAWFTWFLGQRTSDVLCGIKGIERRQYERVHRNWGFLGVFDPFGDFELLFGVARLALTVCEVPTKYAPRVYGETKTRVFRHGWRLARIALAAVRRFKCR